jgi:O-antigen ligase
VVVWLKNPRRMIAPVLMAAVLFVGFFFLPEANKERVRSAMEWEQDANAVTRIELWKNGLDMFAGSPVLGVGPGNFRVASAWNQAALKGYGVVPHQLTEAAPELLEATLVPHSIYIQALAELGAVGMAVLLAMFWVFFRLNARTRKRVLERGLGRHNFEYCLALALDLAMVAFMTNGAFITVLYYPHLWVLLGLASGLNHASTRLSAAQAQPQPQRTRLQYGWCAD